MPRTKKLITKKKKTNRVSPSRSSASAKATVVVNVNSNKRRVSPSRSSAAKTSSRVSPSRSNAATPTVVLSAATQPYPVNNSDVSQHIDSLVKLLKHQTLANTYKEPEKLLIEKASETIPVHTVVKKEEHVLTPRIEEEKPLMEGIIKVESVKTPIVYPKAVSFEVPLRNPNSESRFEKLLHAAEKSPKDTSVYNDSPESPYLPNKTALREYLSYYNDDLKGIQNFSDNQLRQLVKVNEKYGLEAMIVRAEEIKKERKKK